MAKHLRQGSTDRPSLTRAQVAKVLGKDVSWVRRREGKDLHPTLEAGAHRFDPAEVEALRQRIMDEQMSDELAADVVARVHAFFETHRSSPFSVTVDGITERTRASPRTVRAMHSKWKAEQEDLGCLVPRLLTREQLRAREQAEIKAIDREYDERMAKFEREFDDLRKRHEAQLKRTEEDLAARQIRYDAERARFFASLTGKSPR